MEKTNLYDWLVANDFVEWCKPLIDAAGWKWRYTDGKIEIQTEPSISETPWHHVNPDHRLKCGLWHSIMFGIIGPRVGKRFVPSKCQECYKVVVRPKTVSQLFKLVDIQEKMGRPCKCGIEQRKSVHGLYGGYFYNVGLNEGLECYHAVRKEIDQTFGPDIQVFLKKACTEYEHACGDSDKWEITPEQLHIENLIERWLVVDNREIKQPEKLVHNTHRKWIEFAYANGDETYAEFTGGKPLYPAYKTYEHLKNE